MRRLDARSSSPSGRQNAPEVVSLFRRFYLRYLIQSYKGSFLGAFWLILSPLFQMAVYTTVFGFIFDGRYEGVADQTKLDYALGIFLSLTIFQAISEILSVSPSAILGQPNLVKKVVMPLEVIPAAHAAVALTRFLVSLTLVFIFTFVFADGPSSRTIFLPVVIGPLLLIGLGIAWLFSALGVFFRDIQNFVAPLSMVILYSSAVFYSRPMIPEAFWGFLRFNPVLHMIEQARRTVLWGEPVQVWGILFAYSFGLACAAIGYAVFRRLRPTFADVL